MIKGLTPKRVKKNVGMNPIARAVARENLRKAILDQKIQLYLLEEGAQCAEICIILAQILSTLIEAAQIDKVDLNISEARIARGAVSACEQMIETDRFSRTNIVALEKGLDAAVSLNALISPESFNKAWNSKPRLVG